GEPGLDGAQLDSGMCSLPEPSNAVRTAIDLFKKVGICPEDIDAIPGETPTGVDAIEVTDLQTSTESGPGLPTSGSVLQRLVDQFDVQESYGILAATGLSLGHFAEARQYLKQEMNAFARSKTATLLDPKAYVYPVFAATRTIPSQPDPIYYAT